MSDQHSYEQFLALCRQDLPTFVAKVFAILNPATLFMANWHHHSMAAALKDIQDGKEKRLIVNSCPRSAKSTFISVAWVAFLLGHNPSLQIIVVSHNMALANDLAHQFRKIMNSDWYRQVFPNLSGKPDTDNETTFRTSAGGGRFAVSVGTGVTGLGADIIIIDDPIDTDAAKSPEACAKVNQWIAKTLMTRLNSKTEGRIVLVMQRVSIFDTTAFLMEKEEWRHLCLPAKTDVDAKIPLYDGDFHVWKQGDLLHPEFLPEKELATQRKYLGDADYSAQYLQKPSAQGAGNIDLSLFRRWETLPKFSGHTILSVDPATGIQSGSRSAIQLWHLSNGELFLRKFGAEVLPFYELREKIIRLKSVFKVDRILIERKSSGESLYEELERHYGLEASFDLLVGINPRRDKETRMAQAMLMVAEGRVYLPPTGQNMASFEQEVLGFPEADHDDQVDAMSQVINWVQRLENGPQVHVSFA